MRESRLSGSVEGVVCKHDSYSDFLYETKRVAGTRITRLPQRVCFRCDAFVALPCGERLRLRPKDGGINPPLHGPDSVGANRPAGTREALPGTICGTCVLRFKRKGTNYRAPTKKNSWRAIPTHAQKSLSGSSRREASA